MCVSVFEWSGVSCRGYLKQAGQGLTGCIQYASACMGCMHAMHAMYACTTDLIERIGTLSSPAGMDKT